MIYNIRKMQSKDNITVLIYAHNEESDIMDAIENAHLLTKNVTVIDIASTDKTAIVARRQKAQVVSTEFTRYVEPARMRGIQSIKTPWLFILDADERITEELAKEIRETTDNAHHTHYRVLRKNIFGKKKWLKHGGWWPDSQIRLIQTESIHDWPKTIHSTPRIEGSEGQLSSPLLHYFHGDFTTMVQKTAVFEDIESDLLFNAKKSVRVRTFMRKFFGELNRRLVLQMGWRDGIIGIIESLYQAYSKTITYLFLYEKTYEKKKSSAL